MNDSDRYAVSLENMEVLRDQVELQAREIERLKAGQESLILVRDDYKRQANEYRALWSKSVAKYRKDPWQASGTDWCSSIHRNPDAKAWADFFVAVFPGQADKHELMIGWFANAMMAMHDHLKAQPSGVVLPDRKPVEPLDFNRTTADVEAIAHNACLDEIARLNSSPAIAGDEREAFEDAVRQHHQGDMRHLEARTDSGYYVHHIQELWLIWQARAALSANHGEQVRVPVEPTEAMRKAAQDKLAGEGLIVTDWLIHTAYSAMLAAAPSAGSQGGDV